MRLILLAIFAASAISMSPPLEAGPLNHKVVPKGAGLVAHFDMEAFRKHWVFGDLKTKITAEAEGDDLKKKVAEAVMRDIKGITLWAAPDGENGAVVVQGALQSTVNDLIKLAPKHDTKKLGKRTAHRLGKEDDDAFVIMDSAWAVVSDDWKLLKKGVNVMDGKAPSIDRRKVTMQAPGNILFVGVLSEKILDRAQEEASSEVLKKGALKHAGVVFGEHKSETYLRVVVKMSSQEQAEQITSILQGVLALGALKVDEELPKKILSKIQLKREGATVRLEVAMSEQELRELVEQAEGGKKSKSTPKEAVQVWQVTPLALDLADAALSERSVEELAVAAQRGDRAAFDEIAKRLRPKLWAFLVSKTQNADDAEDIAQEALVRAFERIDSYQQRYRFSTWLFTIAARLAVDHHRGKRTQLSLNEELVPGSHRDSDAVHDGRRLWAAAKRILKDREYRALYCRYVDGMSVAEISRSLGITSVSTKVMLFRARRKLAQETTK